MMYNFGGVPISPEQEGLRLSFTIRPATEADFPQIVEIINSQVPDPITLEGLLRDEKLRDPKYPLHRVVAEGPEGDVWGYGLSFHGSWHKPEHFFIRVRVAKPYQGQGAGGALFREAERFATVSGARVLETDVRDNDREALAWLVRRGFRNEEHIFESALDLRAWDPSPFAPAIARTEAAGIRFVTLAEAAQGEEMYRRFYDLYVRLFRDVPVFGQNPFSPYDEWLKYVKGDPHWTPELVILALHEDRWVAMTDLGPTDAGGVYQRLTAVDREYRGLGISLAIKVLSLIKVKALGYPHTRTNNHSANAPMLATNRRLGYVPEPGVFFCRRQVMQ